MVIPFCFLIFQILNVADTDFKNIMGRINTVAAYSETLLRVFPFLLVVQLALKWCNAYSKVAKWTGLDDWADADGESQAEESLGSIECDVEHLTRNTLI